MNNLYVLMNKDNLVFYFTIGEGNLFDVDIVSEPHSVIPYILSHGADLGYFLGARMYSLTQDEIRDLFSFLKITTIAEYIELTHFVTISDTFWVKNVNDSVTWCEISPYRNGLPKCITEYQLNIVKGFPKYWRFKNNKLELIKGSSLSEGSIEAFSEIYAYQLAKYLGLDALEYRHTQFRGIHCTVCNCLTSESTGMISGKYLFTKEDASYASVLRYCKDFKYTLCLDILTLNTDRHLNNISFMIDNDTQIIQGLSKVYDNNRSLLALFHPNVLVTAYVDTLTLYNACNFIDLYDKIRDNDTDVLMRRALNFKFKQVVKTKDFPPERLDMLTELVHIQANKCLKTIN